MSLNFDVFEEALNEYEKTKYVSNEEQKICEQKICEHKNINNITCSVYCIDCGEELAKTIFQDKEWRYYGISDTKRSTDPTRVQARKSEEKNIFKDVENMNFSHKIISLANQMYIQVTNGKIFRGDSRKSIIFACIFHSYKLSGFPQTHEKLIKLFNLNRKTGLKGLRHVNLNIPKDSSIHTTYISPINILEDIMEKFITTQQQKTEVIEIYNQIKNKSSKLNRSRPQSVASGIIYYWICKKNIDISLKDFAKQTDLSALTIIKIAKEICNILNTPEIILN